MKIGNPTDKPTLPATASTVAQSRAAPAEAAKSGNGPPVNAAQAKAEASTKVALSSTAAKLLEGVGASMSEFDTQKVTRITQAITDRKFTVNAEVIADKLIANAQELLSKAAR